MSSIRAMIVDDEKEYIDALSERLSIRGVEVSCAYSGEDALVILEDMETVQASVAHLIAERERLRQVLAAIPWLEPLPSQANFVLCRLWDRSGQKLANALAQRGILIRKLSHPALAEYVRITVGRPEQNDALVAALREL